MEVPAAAGWKAVDWPLSPGLKTMGLEVMVPTEVLELVTGTLMGATPGLMGRKN